MTKQVFITKISKFLPNSPVGNDEIEDHLGKIDGKASRARRIILRNNGIKTRHYVVDKEGNFSHNNAQLTAEAIRQLQSKDFDLKDIEVLACGTSAPDQSLPSHTSMVHGELGSAPIELFSPSGACCSGMHAMKYAYMSVLSEQSNNAVCCGSELISPMMLAKNFEEETGKLNKLDQLPIIAFDKDFLRWMLSDGAGAALLQSKPAKGLNLKIEWIEGTSYAHEFETCMYAASTKEKDTSLKSWKFMNAQEWLDHSVFAMKQDVKLLGKNITDLGAKFLKEICYKRNFNVNDIDFFLPHLSSMFFWDKAVQSMKDYDVCIPEEKWFTNLTRVGNVGSASIYLMLEELLREDKIKAGDRILLMVPESARFSYSYALLTAEEH
ncbi:MAG: beta-ketoacyl-ACP synthase III [Chitinophagales bacterium]